MNSTDRDALEHSRHAQVPLAEGPLRPALSEGRVADESVDVVLGDKSGERLSVGGYRVGASAQRAQEEAPKMELDERRNMGNCLCARSRTIDPAHSFIDMTQREQSQSNEVASGDFDVLPEAVRKFAMRPAFVKAKRRLQMAMRAGEVADEPTCGAEDAVPGASFRQMRLSFDFAQKKAGHLLRRADLAAR